MSCDKKAADAGMVEKAKITAISGKDKVAGAAGGALGTAEKYGKDGKDAVGNYMHKDKKEEPGVVGDCMHKEKKEAPAGGGVGDCVKKDKKEEPGVVGDYVNKAKGLFK